MDYDTIAHSYDRRYSLHAYAGIRRALFDLAERTGPGRRRVLEVGCGTGRWLKEFEGAGFDIAGIDRSTEMLTRASCSGDLRLGHAEALPWSEGAFDLVFCVNALHHFHSPRAAIAEAHRVLRHGGAFISVGLDPAVSAGTWYVYQFFPTTLRRDLERFPSAEQRRRWFDEAGFDRIDIAVAEHVSSATGFEQALANGILARSFTSQLTELAEDEYAAGLEAIRLAAAREESFRVVVELDLYATLGWKAV
ncbi:MAG TPA: class I SAM-dependent methyltransferase [Polyangia bacterium]|jgi:SAM-dependent methyltransferase